MDIVINIVLALVAVALVLSSLRIVAENERFVVSTAGRFVKLAGPGLVLRLPGTLQRYTRIKIGDIGTYRGEELGEFRGALVPVAETSAATNDPIQITAFRDDKVWVSQAAARIVVCEKCGHENRVVA